MKPTSIMVVEDEGIVAADIQHRLRGMGYGIAAVVESGEEAERTAGSARPDLVLMDILLKGDIDGVEAAEVSLAEADSRVDHFMVQMRGPLADSYTGYFLAAGKYELIHVYGLRAELPARWAARRLGIPAVIIMPKHTPNVKVEHTRAHGAERRERAPRLRACRGTKRKRPPRRISRRTTRCS
jgi:chemotaxis response regulator CheB